MKRRAVFILGAKWKALVRGWRRDCVVGGMETRFQWRKAHSRTAKCEALHIAPRLFFMFLFFIPLTIRQQSIIYPHKFWLSGEILGDWNKNIKKQPFSDASASHLSLVVWHVWFQAEAWIIHTTSPTPPSYEVGGIAKRIKTARLRRKTKPGRDVILHVRP